MRLNILNFHVRSVPFDTCGELACTYVAEVSTISMAAADRAPAADREIY